ncbi:MAG: TetR/AcrR family transcriptional regulator [Bacteroidota bacterium]
MPTPTFERLKAERKAEIRKLALTEFALHAYESASVSRIVKQLGISSNGTFFRYFKTKRDLYFWLMQEATNKRLEYLQSAPAKIGSLREFLEEQFFQKIDFDLQYPLYGQFLNNSLQERHSKDLGNLKLTTLKRFVDLNERLLAPFQKLGQLKSDLALRTMAFTIVQHQNAFFDYIALAYQLDIKASLGQKQQVAQIPNEELRGHVRTYLQVLMEGIST